MASVDDAANAVEKLVDSELHGRRILIREDRESGRRGEDRRDNYDQSQHSRSFRENANTEVIEVSSNRLYVHNLAWRVSWQDLKDHFRQAGEVVRSEIFTQGPGGRSKGCGIVEMASVDDAANAVEKLVDSELHGRRILIREDRESGRRGEDRQAGREDSLHREDAFEENEGGRTPPVDAPPEPQASDFEDVTPSEKQMTSST
jgi:RNA recognition motif-containing protein